MRRPGRRAPSGDARRILALALALARTLLRLAGVLWLALGALPAHACTGTACVSAGPRLASVDSSQGVLLNALLGGLTGSTLTLSLADWNALASGDLGVASTLSALQTSLGVASPTSALATSATLAQVLTAAATAASGENRTSLSAALNDLKLPLQTVGGGIRLGDLLASDGHFGTTRLNALELVTGVIQLYNARNVATTPAPLTLSAASLGLSGIASSVSMAAQVVEPPVFVCGPVGATFHTATIRLKLGVTLVTVDLNTAPLAAIPLVSSVSARLTRLDLYAEVARADGTITSIDAIAAAFRVQATPGVADLYLGSIADAVFFDRAHGLNAASDLGWSTIGAVTVNGIGVGLQARAVAHGAAGSATTLAFGGAHPQGYTVSAGAGFATGLVTSLTGNLQISLTTGLGTLEAPVGTLLKPIVQAALPSVLQSLVDGLIDPLLRLLGVGLGQAQINAGGTVLVCSISGSVYEDANHSGRMEGGEAGTGLVLYAKLVPATPPGAAALAVATIDPVSGGYAFAGVNAGAAYQVVVNASAAAAQVAPAVPAGWLALEGSTLRLAATLATTDLAGLRAGLYHGSRVAGSVFVDDGRGGGSAHNGVRDGAETALAGVALTLTDAGGSVVHDRTTSGDGGAYLLWIPYAAGAGPLRVTHAVPADRVAVSSTAGTTGGTAALAAGAVQFANVAGTAYTGVDFGDVPANRYDPDGRQPVAPGGVAFFAHAFVAGSAGQVGFAVAATGPPSWTATLYPDPDCDGRLDGTEAPLGTAVLDLAAGQRVCLVVKVAVPLEAANGLQLSVVPTAHWVYQRSGATSDHARTDLVTVDATGAGPLRLSKTVDRSMAASGELVTYTLTYLNVGGAPVTAVRLLDATPAYTVFAAAACAAPVAAAPACAVTAAPAVGGTGRIEWSLGGALPGGAGGSVTLSVLLQ